MSKVSKVHSKAQEFRMPHSQGDTIIKTHCLTKGIPSHAFFLHPIFPESRRGDERIWKTKRLYPDKKSSERIQQPMTYYNQLLEKPETNQYPCISFHAHLSHASRNSPMLEPPKSKGWHPASQWEGTNRTTGNSKPSNMDSWINFPAIMNSLSSLFSCSNQCPPVLPETAGHSAESVLPSPHFWTHPFKVRRKTMTSFGQ